MKTYGFSDLERTKRLTSKSSFRLASVSKQFTAPEEQSVRLTSRQAEIPFTIENQLDNPANVSIHLKSDGRIRFPEGETVNTTLLPGNNRISL